MNRIKRVKFIGIVDKLASTPTGHSEGGRTIRPSACSIAQATDLISEYECEFGSFENSCDEYASIVSDDLEKLGEICVYLSNRLSAIEDKENNANFNLVYCIKLELDSLGRYASEWKSWIERVNLVKDRWLQIKGGQGNGYFF